MSVWQDEDAAINKRSTSGAKVLVGPRRHRRRAVVCRPGQFDRGGDGMGRFDRGGDGMDGSGQLVRHDRRLSVETQIPLKVGIYEKPVVTPK